MKKGAVALLACLFPTYLFAAKINWTLSVDLKEQKLDEGESSITVGDWSCSVTKTHRDSDKTEMRELACRVENGLKVSMMVVCYFDKKTRTLRQDQTGLMGLHQKSSFVRSVGLICK